MIHLMRNNYELPIANVVTAPKATLAVMAALVLLTAMWVSACAQLEPKVELGIDRLLIDPPRLVEGKRLGLITNPTGMTGDLRSTVDALHEDHRFQLIALYGPEHGVRGDVFAGNTISDYTDAETGLPVYSLYGKTRKPTTEMLSNVDVLLFDIQDIGIRPYTYIYTMAYAMEAAREHDLPFVVLDRPNPLGGKNVEGPVLRDEFKSFIGLYPIPYIHGMTAGELARLFNSEFGINCELTVISMSGWKRDMLFEDTGLLWVPTSPHLPHAKTAFYIAATGLYGELGTLSEGVGTPLPFEICGAPWVNGDQLAAEMNSLDLPGVFFRPIYFKSYYLRFQNESCQGVQIHITDFRTFQPLRTQIHLLTGLRKLFPEHDYFEQSDRISSFNRAAGTDQLIAEIRGGTSAQGIIAAWQDELQQFMAVREKYLLYR